MAAKIPTKVRLDRAAISLFAKLQVDGASTREIAALAEIAEGTLYRHYSSKEEMALSLFIRHYLALGEALNEALDQAATLEAGLKALVKRAYKQFDDDPELCAFLILHQHRYLSAIEEGEPTPVQVLRRAIAQAIKAGDLPKQNVEDAVAMVLGVLLQPAVAHTYGQLKGTLTKRSKRVAQAAFAVLQSAKA